MTVVSRHVVTELDPQAEMKMIPNQCGQLKKHIKKHCVCQPNKKYRLMGRKNSASLI